MIKKENQKSRRYFMKTGLTGIAGISMFPTIAKGKIDSPAANKETTIPPISRTLGKTGIRIPVVSMGVMNADNPKLVEAALDSGIKMLDTAHGYQRGRNEEMIGKIIKNRPRDSYVIGTKIYESRDMKTGLFPAEATGDSIFEKFEISLKRLGIDHVDILYLHNISRKESLLFEPYLNALLKLKKQGKTNFIGVSTHVNEPEVIRAAADSKVYDVVLTAYNFRQPHWQKVKKAIEYAARAGLGIVAMKTQAGVYWDRERLHPINMTAALKWVLNDPNVHTAIPGFTTFDQIQLDLTVLKDLTLTREEKKDLEKGEKMSLAGLYCSQCGTCISQCTHQLDIPTLMRSYMYAYGYRNLGQARDTLLSANSHALPCYTCSTCSIKCTQGFNVREKILDISRLKNIPEEFLV
jgi:predicted aldo/keto reductase-like oxidoreductase